MATVHCYSTTRSETAPTATLHCTLPTTPSYCTTPLHGTTSYLPFDNAHHRTKRPTTPKVVAYLREGWPNAGHYHSQGYHQASLVPGGGVVE